MKTYQFVTVAVLLALIVVGMAWKGHQMKKKCNCSSTTLPAIDEDDETGG